jgi:hypothetical protein
MRFMTLRHGEQNSPSILLRGGRGSEQAVFAPPPATELEMADPTSDPTSSPLDPEQRPEAYRDLQLFSFFLFCFCFRRWESGKG